MAQKKSTFSKKTTKPTAVKTAKSAANSAKSEKLKPTIEATTDSNKRPKLPAAWQIARSSADVLWKHKWLFLGIAGIYALLTLFFVRGGLNPGISGASLTESVRASLEDNLGQIGTGLAAITLLMTSSSGSAGDGSSAYQPLLVVIVSLATIWSLRHVLAGEKVRIRDGFYQGMFPLVPVILVVMVIGLQLLPLVFGGTLYSLAIVNGIAANVFEKLAWGLVFFGLAVLSFYMLCSSIFALYVATLPKATPMQALRSARQLVRHRRLAILRKLFFMILVLTLVITIFMLPIVLWLTAFAPWIFFSLTMLSLIVVITYMYMLYRELLK